MFRGYRCCELISVAGARGGGRVTCPCRATCRSLPEIGDCQPGSCDFGSARPFHGLSDGMGVGVGWGVGGGGVGHSVPVRATPSWSESLCFGQGHSVLVRA